MKPYYLPLNCRPNITILTTEIKICEQTSTELEIYIIERARFIIRTSDSFQFKCLMIHRNALKLVYKNKKSSLIEFN